MRVLDCQDLVASEACYHITCIGRFSLNKNQKSSDATTAERPVCNAEQEILIFFANGLNQRQRYIQCLKFRVKLLSL